MANDLEDFNAMRWTIAVQQCHIFKEMMEQLNLSGLIRAGNAAESLGPILKPTLYREQGEALRIDMAILNAAAEFTSKVGEIIAEAKKRST